MKYMKLCLAAIVLSLMVTPLWAHENVRVVKTGIGVSFGYYDPYGPRYYDYDDSYYWRHHHHRHHHHDNYWHDRDWR